MNVSEAQLYYFSPTHTSKRVGEAVAAGLQAARLVENDLTHTPADDAILPSSSVAVVAVPVYRGSVAPLALERLQGLHGDGTPVVLLAVYGNRDYEHALDDLDRFMTERGFVTVAAGDIRRRAFVQYTADSGCRRTARCRRFAAGPEIRRESAR